MKDRDYSQLAQMDGMFKAAGIEHFTAREVCTMRKTRNRAVAIPPAGWWGRMVYSLQIAEMLRSIMGHPLSIGNGYRPPDYNKAVGGARGSQHTKFRALDIDLPMDQRSRENQEKFYETTCELWLEYGDEYAMGLGLYRPWRGTRVHIDTGARRRYWKSKYVRPILEGMR